MKWPGESHACRGILTSLPLLELPLPLISSVFRRNTINHYRTTLQFLLFTNHLSSPSSAVRRGPCREDPSPTLCSFLFFSWRSACSLGFNVRDWELGCVANTLVNRNEWCWFFFIFRFFLCYLCSVLRIILEQILCIT